MVNNYNFISPFYDLLKKTVFGDYLLNTECHFLKEIPKNSRILVIGCGTSKFLENIDLDQCKEIVCLDKSKKMCHLSLKRAKKLGILQKCKVYNKDFINFSPSGSYDIIAMPYFLDCQSDLVIPNILQKTRSMMSKDTYLIITDFSNRNHNNLINNVLIKLMYLFFKISTGIPRKSLPDYDRFIQNEGLKLQSIHLNKSGLLFSKKIKINTY